MKSNGGLFHFERKSTLSEVRARLVASSSSGGDSHFLFLADETLISLMKLKVTRSTFLHVRRDGEDELRSDCCELLLRPIRCFCR